MTACATCTPRGPNSRARLCARARRANFPVAKEAQFAEPLSAAVAEVNIRVGGWGDWEEEEGEGEGTEARRRGRMAREKR